MVGVVEDEDVAAAAEVSGWPVVGSRISTSIPKKGNVAEPGLVGVMAGKGVKIILPVSINKSHFSLN